MNDKIEIQLSKTKITLLLIAAILFVVLGILFVTNTEKYASSLLRSPAIVKTLGVVAIVFFGLCSVFAFKKLFDRKAGLIIDQNGITDNSGGTSVGFVDWKDITGAQTVQVASTKFIILHVNNPDTYIAKAKNEIYRRAMNANYNAYGSPISITSNSLKIKFKKLEGLIMNEIEKIKNR